MKIPANVKKLVVLLLALTLISTATGCRMPMNEDGTIKLIELATTFKETMDTESWFAALIVWPMAQFLNRVTPVIGVGGAILLLTVLVNGVLMIFTMKSQVAQQQMQLIQPELDKINRKYEGKTDDASRMRQVFLNILDNGAKHGGEGGRITAEIHLEGKEVVIRIRDFGPGIPEEELPLIKKKFYKGSSKARGSGIGLAVCEEIVTMHGGSLDIANAEGGGTLVTIRLPVEEK